MMRTTSQTALRARTLTSSTVEGRATKLAGKVALLHVGEPTYGAMLALRYAREGADVALVYPEPCAELEQVQQQIESLGARCVLYEVDLEDSWNCGLVVQSTTECLGPVDIVVDARGAVVLVEEGEELTPRQLQTAVSARASDSRGATHSAA